LKTIKLFAALGLSSMLLIGCSSTSTNTTNTSNTSSSSNASNTSSSTSNTSTSTANSNTSSSTSSTGAGEVFKHEEGGIQFTVPAGWKTKNEGETLTVMTPDNALSMSFWVPKNEDYDQAIKEIGTELEKVVKNSKVTEPGKAGTLNGMETYSSSGTGEVEGTEIVWDVSVFKAKKPVFVFSFGRPGDMDKHSKEFEEFSKSIKRIG
jgi:predicted Zn-dependent protease